MRLQLSNPNDRRCAERDKSQSSDLLLEESQLSRKCSNRSEAPSSQTTELRFLGGGLCVRQLRRHRGGNSGRLFSLLKNTLQLGGQCGIGTFRKQKLAACIHIHIDRITELHLPGRHKI